VFAAFYLFSGTARQAAVFRAEGNYADFQASGMRNLNAFVLEDFLGATFFHLVLGPLLAGALGWVGSLAGKAVRKVRGLPPNAERAQASNTLGQR
jgi:hypothetical protein